MNDWQPTPTSSGYWWVYVPGLKNLVIVNVILPLNIAVGELGKLKISVYPGPWLKIEEPSYKPQ